MERTLVDGVPVLWAPVPGPLTAGLVLGVGRRDESVVHAGLTQAVAAAARGDYDPPGSTSLQHRLSRWERERPPAYRLVNGAAAAVQTGVAVVLAHRVDGDVTSGTGALTALFALGALGSLWSTRPPKH